MSDQLVLAWPVDVANSTFGPTQATVTILLITLGCRAPVMNNYRTTKRARFELVHAFLPDSGTSRFLP